ncbi:hypothetical protein CDD83_2010 [Cordyceps sp. RAO-2017]|nr:hypothetical protein CDD83_2010 [Cordyceps sp. RAO-2017]
MAMLDRPSISAKASKTAADEPSQDAVTHCKPLGACVSSCGPADHPVKGIRSERLSQPQPEHGEEIKEKKHHSPALSPPPSFPPLGKGGDGEPDDSDRADARNPTPAETSRTAPCCPRRPFCPSPFGPSPPLLAPAGQNVFRRPLETYVHTLSRREQLADHGPSGKDAPMPADGRLCVIRSNSQANIQGPEPASGHTRAPPVARALTLPSNMTGVRRVPSGCIDTLLFIGRLAPYLLRPVLPPPGLCAGDGYRIVPSPTVFCASPPPGSTHQSTATVLAALIKYWPSAIGSVLRTSLGSCVWRLGRISIANLSPSFCPLLSSSLLGSGPRRRRGGPRAFPLSQSARRLGSSAVRASSHMRGDARRQFLS